MNMRIKVYLLGIVFILSGTISCKRDNNWKTITEDPEMYHQGIARLTQIIKYDIFSPPVASRIYAYSALAGYEALRFGYEDYQSMAGILKGLSTFPEPERGKEYCYPLCGIAALIFTGKALVFSESQVSDLQDEFFVKFTEAGVPNDVFERSVSFARLISDHVLQWSKTDNYAKTRSLPKYTISSREPSRWVPTPPSYGDALEPYWMHQRQWALDSLTQVQVDPPVDFSIDKNSPFYALAMEVYEIQQNITPEQEATAWYWDDNPFAVNARGHLMAARKKTSPGGHWMNIASATCRVAGANIPHSASVLMKTAIALMDGFIMTWQEKFRTNLIRPETYINQYIDGNFQPIIETPPFPEHPSGHATISAAAATVLTLEFGEPFTFTDDTEVEYDMEARTYNSFMDAAREAAMSRLYGGIHFRTGNESGTKLGTEIGQIVHKKILAKR
jgi:hypothetical protein